MAGAGILGKVFRFGNRAQGFFSFLAADLDRPYASVKIL
jgi:hypothetical protein